MDEENSAAVTTSTGNSVNVTRDTIPEPVSPSSATATTTLSLEDCVYKGEGNSNIVIALPKERKVLRFRKLLPQDVVSPEIAGFQRVEREVEFVKFVASCFLGPYLQIPEIICVNTENVTQLLEAIRHFRPDERCWKKTVDIYATKSPDYTFLQKEFDFNCSYVRNETFCVEIKPKQGYLQSDDVLAKTFLRCPYCLMQYFKLRSETIKHRSSYCPFDLFSGEKTRMRQALRGLLKSPQNNLRIFMDGQIIYGKGSSLIELERILKEWFQSRPNSSRFDKNGESIDEYMEQFCDLICEALLRPTFSSIHFNYDRNHNYGSRCAQKNNLEPTTTTRIDQALVEKANKLVHSNPCNLKPGKLPSNSVLGRILRMQKLSFIDPEYVYDIYSKYRESLTDDIIYSDLIKTYEVDSKDTFYFEQKETNDTTEITSITRCLQKYLLFTCARDCSILMSFREINATSKIPSEYRGDVIRMPNGSSFVRDVRITDVDPKSLRCIDKHRQRDTDIFKSIISLFSEGGAR